jgi:hypothetical protein
LPFRNLHFLLFFSFFEQKQRLMLEAEVVVFYFS